MDKEKKCNKCGDCCRSFAVRFQVEHPEYTGWNVFYNVLHKGIACQVESGPGSSYMVIQVRKKCSMLVEYENGITECKIYDKRPEVCKEWPPERLRQSEEMPRCSLMDPRDKELDKEELEKYIFHSIPPFLEKIYEEMKNDHHKELLAKWSPWGDKK